MSSKIFRKGLTAGLVLSLLLPLAPILRAAPQAEPDKLSACDTHTVVDVLANDSSPGGRELSVSLTSPGNCPGSIYDLGDGLFDVGEALDGLESCHFTYAATDGAGTVTSDVTLTCSGGTPPGGGPLSALDQRRRDALSAVNDYFSLGGEVSQIETAPGVFVTVPQPNQTLAGVLWSRERFYWEKILTLLALHDLGVLDGSAVENARRLIRFQFGVFPGPIPGNLNQQPFELNVRNQAMRVYQLYQDVLFPNGGDPQDPNHDIWQTFDSRMKSAAAANLADCTGSGSCPHTENHMTLLNSFHVLSQQLAGVPPSDQKAIDHRNWWLAFLQHSIEGGFQEWSSGYFHWTLQAIVNLADFAEDPDLRRMAAIALDYQLAILAEQSTHGGNVASASVRSYPYEILGNITQHQTHILHTLFTGGDLSATEGFNTRSVEMAASNYRPLEIVRDAMFGLEPNRTSRITQEGRYRGSGDPWYHHNYRGHHYSLSANITPNPSYYHPHDTVIAYLKTDRDPRSHVVPIGYHPADVDRNKRRDTTDASERGFGYRNVVIYTQGGIRPGCGSSTAPQCSPPNQPPRLYLTDDFNQPGLGVQFENGWAFMRNGNDAGATYVAWRPSIGSPMFDPEDHTDLHFIYGGTFLRSSHTSTGTEGIACVLEVGDAESFGSYQAFKNSVKGRNPGGFGGRYYNAINEQGDPVQLDYRPVSGGIYRYYVGGQNVTPGSSYPRMQGQRLNGTTLSVGSSSVFFDVANLDVVGATDRMPSSFVFGEGPISTDPPQLTDPVGASVEEGGRATFSITASGGSGPILYEWQAGLTHGGPWTAVSGAHYSGTDTPTLTIDPVPMSLDGLYFRAQVSDDHHTVYSAGAQLTVIPAVTGCDPPPVAIDDTFTTPFNTQLTIDMDTELFHNDTVPNPVWGGLRPPAPSPGTATPHPGNLLTYMPQAGFEGIDTFGYRVESSDDPSCYAEAVVTVIVEPDDPPPIDCPAIARDDEFVVPFGGTWETAFWGAVLLNDTPASLSNPEIVRSPAGNLELGPVGPIYTPPAVYQETDSFDYTVYSNGDPANCTSQPATVTFHITPPELIPSFTRSCAGLRCTFDASDSTGEGLSFSWSFGDGSSGTGMSVVHDFPAAGSYQVALTVTDIVPRQSTVTLATRPVLANNDSIQAVFGTTLNEPLSTLLANDQGVSPQFKGLTSQPSNGQVTTSGNTFSYTPAVCGGGTFFGYEITDAGASYSLDSATVGVMVLPDAPPQASFSFTCDELTCQFTDTSSDGTGYAVVGWDFGDGATAGAAATPSHTYAADGVWPVTLTVIDDCSQTSSVSLDVQVSTLATSAASPAEVITATGGEVRLSTSVTGGVAPYIYRWQRKDFDTAGWAGLSNNATYSGAFGPTLTISGADAAVPGWYRCRVLDSADPQVKVFSESAAVYVETGTGDQVIGEVGEVTVDDGAKTVLLGRSYQQPVVFAQPPSALDNETAVIRLRSVESDRFTLAVEEAPDRDGIHGHETVSFLVLEAGDWLLPDGRRLTVGTLSTDATVGVAGASWHSVSWPSPFAHSPSVITQVQSAFDTSWVKTRQTAPSPAGFDVALEPEDAATVPHGVETIGYLGIEPGSGSWNGHPFVAGDTGETVAHLWAPISWSEDLGPTRHFLGGVASYRGGDGSALRFRNLDSTSIEVMVEEDTTVDAEVGHAFENVSYLAIGRSGILRARPNDLEVAMTAPTSLVVSEGTGASFGVTVSGGSAPYAYRWQYSDLGPTEGFVDLIDGGAYAGTDTASLAIDPAALSHGGWYRCRVSDASAPASQVESPVADLTVLPGLSVDGPTPTSAAVSLAGSASFAVTAEGGNGSYAYQWQRSASGPTSGFSDLTNGGGISGANNSSLTVSPAAIGHAGWYRCRIESGGLTVTSDAAVLEVLGTNLVPDPGFEQGTDWTPVAAGGFPATGFYRKGWGIGGPQSGVWGHAISNLAYGTLLSDAFPLTAATDYDVFAWVRGEVDAQDSHQSWSVRLLCYDSAGTLLGVLPAALGGFGAVGATAEEWVHQGSQVTTQSTCASGRVQLTFLEAGGWIGFDDISVIAASGGTNLVPDPGFEQGDGWVEGTHASFPATSLISRASGVGGAYAGTRGYGMNNLALGNLNSDPIMVSAETEYDLYAWVRGHVDADNSASSWSLRALYYDSADTHLGTIKVHNGGAGSPGATPLEWVERGGRVMTPASTAKMTVQLRLREASGWIAFDDISLVEVGTSGNLVSNPGFESGAWAGSANVDHPATGLYHKRWGIAGPRSGVFGQAISNLANGALTSAPIAVSPETEYELRAYLRGEVDGDESKGSVELRAMCYDASGGYLDRRSVFLGAFGAIGPTPTEWIHRGGRFTSCPGAASVRIELRLTEGSGWVDFDDVTLEEVH